MTQCLIRCTIIMMMIFWCTSNINAQEIEGKVGDQSPHCQRQAGEDNPVSVVERTKYIKVYGVYYPVNKTEDGRYVDVYGRYYDEHHLVYLSEERVVPVPDNLLIEPDDIDHHDGLNPLPIRDDDYGGLEEPIHPDVLEQRHQDRIQQYDPVPLPEVVPDTPVHDTPVRDGLRRISFNTAQRLQRAKWGLFAKVQRLIR